MSTTTFPPPRLGRLSTMDDPLPLGGGVQREPLMANAVVGTLVFIFTEVMFFAALISAYMVIRANNMNWVPPESVRLPITTTAFNTTVLLLSGILMFAAKFRHARHKSGAPHLFGYAALLGTFFVVLQGYEWVRLIKVGMTLLSGVFGGTFYLLIGAHALHAVSALVAMAWIWRRLKAGTATGPMVTAMTMYWSFIVLIWPILYSVVYFQ